MAYPLFVHRDIDVWLGAHPSLQRRADWLFAELSARGIAGRPKGVVGPAREVFGLDGHSWRRSGLGGFSYYAWWFEAGESTPFPPQSRVVRAIRPHDEMTALGLDDPAAYAQRDPELLQPLTHEQSLVVGSQARVRLAVGHPGTGKTGALLYAAAAEARRHPQGSQLYVTLSPRLAEDARQFLNGLSDVSDSIEVLTYDELLERWASRSVRHAERLRVSDAAEERAFLGFVADQPPNELNAWKNARSALWAEVRAHLIGRALPFPFDARRQPASSEPFLPRDYYRRQREKDLEGSATRAAWKLAQRFMATRPPSSVHVLAWEVLERLQAGRLDGQLRRLDGLVVDEVQDLTLLQAAVLVEAARRVGQLKPAPPFFIAAGDESQIVHPSGFDWGVYKDLLRERLGADPEEVQLTTNQRSPSPVVEVSNRTAVLYDELPKSYRPQARVEAEQTDAENGRVYLCAAAPDDPALGSLLEMLRETPGSALLVCPGVNPRELAPLLAQEPHVDLIFEPAIAKGLDRQHVVVWEASRVLASLREALESAKRRGDRDPVYLSARRTIDEFRVAVSRATETLVFLDRAEDQPDPLLTGLLDDGVAERISPALLADTFTLRGEDPFERTLEYFQEAEELLGLDPARSMRSLQRADGALQNLRDTAYRRQALQRRVQVRLRVAHRLLAADDPSSYEQAAEQFSEVERSYRELEEPLQARQQALLAQRYRNAPPGSPAVALQLPSLLESYVATLDELASEGLRPHLFALPRAWLEELADRDWRSPAPLRRSVEAAERLAALSGLPDDASVAHALRLRLARLLIEQKAWSEALATLEALGDASPSETACCYEGLRAWEKAAALREAAGELQEALADYRQAGNLSRAADLATRLGEIELADSLRAASDLARQLESLQQVHATRLAEPELQRLADNLRRAAEHLAPRHKTATGQRRR